LIGEGPVVFSCLLTTVSSVVTEEGIGELDGAKPQPKRGVRVSPIKLPGVTQFFQVHWKRLSPIIETHHIGGVILWVFPPMVGLHGDKLHRGQKHEAPGFPGAVMRDFHVFSRNTPSWAHSQEGVHDTERKRNTNDNGNPLLEDR
jgi:hypothetical protein